MGHSLSKISDIVYDNWKRWPEIYDNNRPMIKDPDKIFAGFTLFYMPDDDEPEVISKNKKPRLFNNMLNNVSKSKKKTKKRIPSSKLQVSDQADSKSISKEKINLSKKESNIILKIGKAVKLNQKGIEKKNMEKGSLLKVIKSKFKKIDL